MQSYEHRSCSYDFDTDLHSLSCEDRFNGTDIQYHKKTVAIEDLTFIGAKSIILKGVTIGKRSIVGAGNVVSRDITDGKI